MNPIEQMRSVWKQARTNKVAGPLNSALRRKINTELGRDRKTNGNFPHAKAQFGYSAAADILAKHGIEINEVVNVFQFEKALSANLRLELAFSTDDPFSPDAISNSLLVVSYTPFGDTDSRGDRTKTKFGVVAYLS